MNITFENFIDLQAEAGSSSVNQPLWNFLLLSFLLHLVIIKLLIDHVSQPQFMRPYKAIPLLTVSINRAGPDVQAERDGQPVTSIDIPDNAEQEHAIDKPVIPLAEPVAGPPEPTVKLPAHYRHSPSIAAQELIERSLAYAAMVAKVIEAQVSPGALMTGSDKARLELAKTMLAEQDERMDNPEQLLVYHNQFGDRVYQMGDKCFAIPAVLFLYTFKEINSIMATPISCRNGRKKNSFNLK